MDGNQSSRRKAPPPPKKLPREKVFGGNAVQLSEDDASKIVGSVVEKGISENKPMPPSAAPRPTVLPFPVARHRSHGPHWAPIVGEFRGVNDENNEEEEEEEDNDTINYGAIANFAQPIVRKKKKGLDLSKWRDLIPSNKVSNSLKKAEQESMTLGMLKLQGNGEAMKISCEKSKSNKPCLETRIEEKSALAIDAMELDRFGKPSSIASNNNGGFKLNNDWSGSTEEDSMSTSHDGKVLQIMSPDISVRKGELTLHRPIMQERDISSSFASSSLESQIDAENHALLQKMSPDQIAEAQAEIRDKINPKLLKLLKKRGEEKLRKQSSSVLDSSAKSGVGTDDMQVDEHLNQDEKVSLVLESDTSSLAMIDALQDKVKSSDGNLVGNLCPPVGSLWDAWSKRVEAVRDLRFSLDGNVVETDFVHAEAGRTLDHCGYTADNVAERDLLRTEGDPGAAGYTIKEALALTRSVVSGQRALALHLLASVLCKALYNINQNEVGRTMRLASNEKSCVDWEAIWAFALGPEPDLILSLRLSLDDNNNSVVLACAKVIECILACEANEYLFHISEKIPAHVKDLYTAPVFRSRPEINVGFLHGGFWKYSTKPSNILLVGEDSVDDVGGEHTIQDDTIVAGQDVVAGLVRMGILSRLRYLLEMSPTMALEECILSILIAVARHSPTCSNAILKCQRLVQIVFERFMMKDKLEVQATLTKSVTLIRVLAQSDQRSCLEFIRNGIFQNMTWHLYGVTSSINDCVKSGEKHFKLAAELMVEQLRFWKVCIKYGHCISYFTTFFPALCLWLNPPTFEKLIEKNVLHEFTSISEEVFLVLEALTGRLPNLYSEEHVSSQFPDNLGNDTGTWCWSDVVPMVNLALKWITLDNDSPLTKFFDLQNGTQSEFVSHNFHISSLLWVISAVMHMLSTVLIKGTALHPFGQGGTVEIGQPLPEFVVVIVWQIVKNGFLSIGDVIDREHSTGKYGVGSFFALLCHLRNQSDYEAALASVCCLQEVIQVTASIDHLIQLAKNQDQHLSSQGWDSLIEGRILDNGILRCSLLQWQVVLFEFVKLVASEWRFVQSIEVFGRGGPAPGVGLGWGASGGGLWSSTVALAQADARFLVALLEILPSSSAKYWDEEETFTMQMINSALSVCLIAGPRDVVIVDKALSILLQIPVLEYLDLSIQHFLQHSEGQKQFKLEYSKDDLVKFSKILSSHFRKRWLSVKKKKPKAKGDASSPRCKTSKKGRILDTIQEEVDISATTSEDCVSFAVEWAHQSLPLPQHWVLSPISMIGDGDYAPSASNRAKPLQDPKEFLEVAKAGLFFLLGIEAMSTKLSDEDHSPLLSLLLVWKLHSLSVVLLSGMGVLEEDRSRNAYEALQILYGKCLNELSFSRSSAAAMLNGKVSQPEIGNYGKDLLRFRSEIHESYPSFVETLVEQFASISYGCLPYGRQIAIYLHRQVEVPVRLAAWSALSNARVLELLPPLDKCIADAGGYLEPTEDDDGVLEAYVKSWVSGALDRAATRTSMAYTIVIHHLSSFIFSSCSGEKLFLRNKFVKSLLRDYSRKQQQQGMMLDLIQYDGSPTSLGKLKQNQDLPSQTGLIAGRFQNLTEACEGNFSLLSEVKKLESSYMNKPVS
ncbi:hypothetical protein Nepgr_019963 [Nepenthes gracilis]|uniref:Transcriptional elongation regulator MINIYO n=1 Tax=Nepenthes gracilis TaxID=150966 RepID=A0AAD3SX45_NEPGR|nr:hypothetical protein Nepgr_019963 [Nepenthes gracilis]